MPWTSPSPATADEAIVASGRNGHDRQRYWPSSGRNGSPWADEAARYPSRRQRPLLFMPGGWTWQCLGMAWRSSS